MIVLFSLLPAYAAGHHVVAVSRPWATHCDMHDSLKAELEKLLGFAVAQLDSAATNCQQGISCLGTLIKYTSLR